MKPRIMFDLLCSQPAGKSKYHGGGEYTKTVFWELCTKHHNDFGELAVCYDYERFIDPWVIDLIDTYKIKKYNAKNKTDIVNCLAEFSKDGETVFYEGMAYGYENVDFPENIKTIGTFHGLRLVEKPIDKNIIHYMNSMNDYKAVISNLLFRHRLQHNIHRSYVESLKRFDHIITVSEWSKHSIMVNFPEIGHGYPSVKAVQHRKSRRHPKG